MAKQQVLRLEVAVGHRHLVQVLQGEDDAAAEKRRHVQREAPEARLGDGRVPLVDVRPGKRIYLLREGEGEKNGGRGEQTTTARQEVRRSSKASRRSGARRATTPGQHKKIRDATMGGPADVINTLVFRFSSPGNAQRCREEERDEENGDIIYGP